MISLGPSINLPDDAITKKFVVYGDPGMGKSSLLCVFCEEIASAGMKFCFIDPTSSAWGLRFSGDGKGRGIELLILGGRHGDIPITPDSGTVVADLVADENVSTIIDIESFKNGKAWEIEDRIRFVADFAKRFYSRQREKRTPIMLVIDECQRFAPQTVDSGEKNVAECRKQLRVIQEEGRTAGIGTLVAAQRSARLDKALSEVTECMIAFRTIGPRSVEAVMDWVGDHVDKAETRSIRESLGSMQRGSALFVSPGWLKMNQVHRVRARSTFDSSATPVGGKIIRASGEGAAPIDLAKYQAKMSEVIERVKGEDPAELRKLISDLQRQNALLADQVRMGATSGQPDAATIERIGNASREQTLTEMRNALLPLVDAIKMLPSFVPEVYFNTTGLWYFTKEAAEQASRDSAWARQETPIAVEQLARNYEIAMPHMPKIGEVKMVRDPSHPDGYSQATSTIGNGALRRVLTALAQRRDGLNYKQLGGRAFVPSKSSTFRACIADGRKNNWIDGGPSLLTITASGLAALGQYEHLPEGQELFEHWSKKLPDGPRSMLRLLWIARKPLDAHTLGVMAQVDSKSSTFRAHLAKLRKLELVIGDRSALRASQELY